MFENVFLLIPAFNEEHTIASVLSDLEKTFCNILVVDDGSVDSTPDIIKNHNVQVVRHHINLGQGAAISTGLQFIAKFTMDLSASLAKLDITIDRFGFESQIIHSVGKSNISYKELPTNIKYTDYSRKKGQKILDGLLILEDLINSKRPK